MKQIRRHLTYANVMSSIAVFLMLGGATAFAATKVGSNEIKANSIKTGKIVKEAVTAGKLKKGAVGESKLADGAVTTNKLADNAVTTPKIANDAVTAGKIASNAVTNGKIASNAVTNGKIANDAVTTEKLQESERSQAFEASITSGTPGLANGLIGTYGEAESVVSLNLPAGNFFVVAQTELINTDVGENHNAVCRLNSAGTQIAEQAATALPGLIFPSGGITVAGIATGGRVELSCRQGATNKVFAFQRKIVATRVATVG